MFVWFTVSVEAEFSISYKLSSMWNTVPQLHYHRQKYPKLCHTQKFICWVTLYNSRNVPANTRHLTTTYKFINPLIRYSSFNFKFSEDMLAYLLKIACKICCRTQPPPNTDIVTVKNKVKLSLFTPRDIEGNGRTSPRFLNLGTKRKWVVSFTPLMF
jgi:hypothetical protein